MVQHLLILILKGSTLTEGPVLTWKWNVMSYYMSIDEKKRVSKKSNDLIIDQITSKIH